MAVVSTTLYINYTSIRKDPRKRLSHSPLRSPVLEWFQSNLWGDILLQGWPDHLIHRGDRLRYIKSEDASEPRKQWQDRQRGEVWGGRKASGVGRGQSRWGNMQLKQAPFLILLSYLESWDFCHFWLILGSASTKSAVFCSVLSMDMDAFTFQRSTCPFIIFDLFVFEPLEVTSFQSFLPRSLHHSHLSHFNVACLYKHNKYLCAFSQRNPPGDMWATAGMFKLVCGFKLQFLYQLAV